MTNGVFRRLTVVDTGRRRRWPPDEKRRIVQESYDSDRSVSEVARNHGISPAHLFQWRKLFRAAATLSAEGAGLVPAMEVSASRGGGRMEIVLKNGRRIVVDHSCAPRNVLTMVRTLERP